MIKIHVEKCNSNNECPHEGGHVVGRCGSIDCDCDGYHTFGELYSHRIELFIALCRQFSGEFSCQDLPNPTWRSLKHGDGTALDGWFILGIFTRPGLQITYHLPILKWDECDFAETLDKAPEFDGHTSDDVLERLKRL